MRRVQRLNGFTLIELIVALAVLSIIVIAFINMFSTAIFGVFRAGDKGTAYTMAKQDVETRIARGESVATESLEIFFDGKKFTIEGGLVETHQFAGNSESEISAFVPLIPVVTIEPKLNHEGVLKPFEVTITGQRTHFSNSSTAQLLNKFGDVVLDNIPVSATNATLAEISINVDLLNVESDYILRITSPVSGKPNEVVRAKYSVYLPKYIAVGSNEIYVTDNGAYWMNRSSSMTFPSFSSLRSVAIGELSAVAVGENGNVLVYNELEGWTRNVISASEDLNDVAWDDKGKRYIVVGEAGTIRASSDGKTWTALYTNALIPLNGVSVTTTGKIVAVGDQGTILYSADGTVWQVKATTTTEAFNGVFAFDNSSSDYYVAVGDSGTIFRSDDGESWTDESEADARHIRRVAHHAGNFIAVGDSGLIFVSTDVGDSWDYALTNPTTQNLYDVAFDTGTSDIFISGEGVILKSTNMNSWVINETISGESLRGLDSK